MSHPGLAVRLRGFGRVAPISDPFVVLALCLSIVTLVGFDAQIMSYVSPQLVMQWGIDRAALGPALSAGLVGLMLGAPLLGTLADRIGRKPVLVLSTIWFGVFALLTTFVSSVEALVALRLLTGVGLGGTLPAVIALISEYSLDRHRATFVTVTISGFSIGSALGGLVAGPLIARWGWQGPFIVGGMLPLLLAPMLWRWMPEATGLPDPSAAPDLPQPKVHLAELFAGRRRFGTPLLWTAIFLNLVALNLIVAWLPIVLSELGFSLAQATSTTAMFHVGGIIGGLMLGALVDRFGYFRVGTITLVAGCACVISIGYSGGSLLALSISILLAGGCVVGAQTLLNSLSGMYYPLSIRAMGSGWALGVGRLGAAIGPLLGEILIARHIGHTALFYIEAIPLYFAAIACLALRRRVPPGTRLFGAGV